MHPYNQTGRRIVICSGGFDPLHSGHIAYFKAAKRLGDVLVVAVNSDEWLTRKKGQPFMSLSERINIVMELAVVDQVITFDDSSGDASDAIAQVLAHAPDNDTVVFANGGDRSNTNTPEQHNYAHNSRVEFAWGVGGEDKKNSSSWILDEWKTSKTLREWGWYRVLDSKPGYKVKELVIEPGKSLSDQRHAMRSEHWYVLKGVCTMLTEINNIKQIHTLKELSSGFVIEKSVWHKAMNRSTAPCHILEVQYGESCDELDIERRDQ
jgi:cytidyltransferase-like protein